MNHNRIRSIIRKIGITIFITYMFMKLRDIIVNGGKLIENDLNNAGDESLENESSDSNDSIKVYRDSDDNNNIGGEIEY